MPFLFPAFSPNSVSKTLPADRLTRVHEDQSQQSRPKAIRGRYYRGRFRKMLAVKYTVVWKKWKSKTQWSIGTLENFLKNRIRKYFVLRSFLLNILEYLSKSLVIKRFLLFWNSLTSDPFYLQSTKHNLLQIDTIKASLTYRWSLEELPKTTVKTEIRNNVLWKKPLEKRGKAKRNS